MSSICQAWTRVSAGVAASRRRKRSPWWQPWLRIGEISEVASLAIPLQRSKRFLLRQYECKSHKRCRVQQLVLNWQTMRRLPKGAGHGRRSGLALDGKLWQRLADPLDRMKHSVGRSQETGCQHHVGRTVLVLAQRAHGSHQRLHRLRQATGLPGHPGLHRPQRHAGASRGSSPRATGTPSTRASSGCWARSSPARSPSRRRSKTST